MTNANQGQGTDSEAEANADSLAKRCADALWSSDHAAKHLGISIDSVTEGRAILSMTVADFMVNGHDICHGGMIFSLADTAFAYACNSYNLVTVASGCTIDFLRPGFKGDRLTATAEVLNQGRRNGLYDVMVTNTEGKVLAQFRGRAARTSGELV